MVVKKSFLEKAEIANLTPVLSNIELAFPFSIILLAIDKDSLLERFKEINKIREKFKFNLQSIIIHWLNKDNFPNELKILEKAFDYKVLFNFEKKLPLKNQEYYIMADTSVSFNYLSFVSFLRGFNNNIDNMFGIFLKTYEYNWLIPVYPEKLKDFMYIPLKTWCAFKGEKKENLINSITVDSVAISAISKKIPSNINFLDKKIFTFPHSYLLNLWLEFKARLLK